MQEKQPYITIFTPCYNRAYCLEKLYHSLQNQDLINFEWLVVDDGSIDETQELFTKWCEEKNPFSIRYIKTKNGGKHRAINKGVKIAEGKLFFIVDSDDYLLSNATAKITHWETTLPEEKKFAGVAGSLMNSKGERIGIKNEREYIDCTSQERDLYGLTGDKAEVFYTNILRKFPFPEFEGENFLTESIVWYTIGKAGYKLRWYNDIIYVCEYLEDGLTKNLEENVKRNPYGTRLALISELQNRKLPLINRLGTYARYAKISIFLGENKKQITNYLGISRLTLNIAILLKFLKDKFAQ